MPKTQYYTATTIDGFIADPDDSLDWLFAVAEGENRFAEFFTGIGAFAMGATTYEWVLAHDDLLENPEKWKSYYADVPCWVFTHRELPPIPGVDLRFVQGDVRPVHEQLSQAAGEKNIWLVGGGELVGRFADAGLLDEVILGMAPATLGAGKPLLPRRLGPDRLELVSAAQNGQFVQITYRLKS
ncbi:dihydrofolate reductase family protein [Hamadaea sp. NPDC050747]|uniref:dihydrofolate reductase family protein n=1 Tax=Hamadaea sp. NPDC050747 TaxID=3155789 RepID=UPI0033FFE643